MELAELQDIWLKYDQNVKDNTRLNKEILKRILLAKPEKRLNWIKIKAGFNLTQPIILILFILVSDIHFRPTVNFFIGLSLFGLVQVIIYYWAIKYYLLIGKIDFSEAVLSIKKKITELEKYKFKTKRLRYILMPIAIMGIFLMFFYKPIFNMEFYTFILLTVLVFFASIYVTFKYFHLQFRKFDKEIAEIIELEKE